AKDRPLRARSDTSVKVDFALIDTSNSFQFYSFEPNGQWQVKQQAVSQVVKKKSKNKVKTQAIIEYQKYLNKTSRPDTTSFDARFDSQDYVYLYRKDNLKKSKDSLYDIVSSNYHAVKGFFKIKYVKLTKEKEIVFSIAPVKNASYFMPRYISYITNKKYIYKGELDKEAFRRAFNRKEIFWDLRILSQGEVLSLRLKTNAKYFELLCQVAFQDGEGKYFASGKSTRSLSELIDKGIGRCAKKFNRDPRPHDASGSRYSKFNYNEIDPRKDDYWLAAFRLVEPYKTKDEKKLNFEEWKAYVQTFYSVGEFQRDNDLNTALVKSGMGISNIDAYIHSGAIEEMMVKYDGVEPDSIFQQFNVIMYKSINTSYACVQQDTKALRGFVLKGKPNYIIRFSMNGIMQVTRPSELESFRTEGKISIPYEEQYDVKGLTSTQISSLILDGQN
ncbi:MAG: hypothetical protein JNL60_04680, partial [Bacteroidia bacterium]|nr:hypothetical protein [Bacteroidia bacterium]